MCCQTFRHRCCDRSAVTMIDLVLVVLMMGVVVAIALPRFSASLATQRADSCAQRIVTDLKLVRRKAMGSSQTTTVDFQPATNTYSSSDIEHFNKSFELYSVDLSEPPYQSELVDADFGGGTSVTFDMFGRPNFGGTISVSAGGAARTITLHPDSGMPILP